MHHLSYSSPKGTPKFPWNSVDVKPWLGSSRCVELNHMLHRLCGPPSIPLSFNLAAVLPRRSAYCVNCGTGGADTSYTYHSSFTAWTTRVSTPVCSPRFRASASVTVQKVAFATGVPPHIYAFHRYTWNSTFLSCPQDNQFPMHSQG